MFSSHLIFLLLEIRKIVLSAINYNFHQAQIMEGKINYVIEVGHANDLNAGAMSVSGPFLK